MPTGLALGTYKLIDFGTAGTAVAGDFSLAGGTVIGYSFSIYGTDLNLTVVGNDWHGASGTGWNAAASWNLSAIPNGQGASAIFAGHGGATVVVDQPTTIGSLLYSSTAVSYNITSSGSNVLTFNNGTYSARITLDSTTSAAQTISAPLSLNSNLLITNNSGVSLTVTGGISESGGSYGLTLSAGTLILGGGSGTSSSYVTNNTYSGNTTVSGGYLKMGTSSQGGWYAISPYSTLVTMPGGTVDLYGKAQTVAGLQGTGGTITSNNGVAVLNVNLSGAVTTTYGGTFISGLVNLTKTGTGTLILSGSGNDCVTTINQGTVQLGIAQALPLIRALTINPAARLR